MEFLPQESIRLYLHPSGSRRLALLMRDFSLLLLELSTERHLAQRGAALTLLGSDGEALPFRESLFAPVTGGYPIYTLRVRDAGGADVALRVFSSPDEDPALYWRVSLTNTSGGPARGALRLFPCTSPDDRYLTGLWDTGYCIYSPNPRVQTMLPSRWRFDGSLLTDGYAACRLGSCRNLALRFAGEDPRHFEFSNYLALAYDLAPGGTASLDGVFAVGDALPAAVEPDAAEARARAYWDAWFSRVTAFPDVGARHNDLFRAQITQCLQMLQRYEDGFLYTRQGCVGRNVWEWEAAHVLTALDRIGLAPWTDEAHRTLLTRWLITDPASPDEGHIANPRVRWANANGAVVWCVAEHLRARGDRALYEELMPPLKRAAAWIERQRSKTAPGETPGLFPAAGASDWPEIGQHFTFTDSVNVMGYRALAAAAEAFGDAEAPMLRARADDYAAALAAVVASLEAGHDESEDYMPTHILGKPFDEVRTHCYMTDGIVYLPMTGCLDPKGKLFGFVERYYERHGLIEHGLRGRLSNLDWGTVGVYGDCYYTGVPETCWFYAFLQKGETARAGEALETMLRFTLSPEFAAAERYSPRSPWYAPWQPNGSASARVIHCMLDYYGAKDNPDFRRRKAIFE